MSLSAAGKAGFLTRIANKSFFWTALAVSMALVIFLPILVIFLQWGATGSGEQQIWEHLLSTKLDRLVLNTIILVVGVAIGVTVLGVSLAWLTAVCEFPGRKIFEWALMLPLAIPAYVMAFVFLSQFNYSGPWQSALRAWFGNSSWFPDIQGPVGVIFVMSLVLYPYVYMLARTAFVNQGRGMMDAARILGLNPWQAFFRISVPVARPAIIGGIALALMETLADFGAVSVFNYDTFTTAIYSAWYGLFNLTVAAQLSSLLLLFVGLTLFMEQKSRKSARYNQNVAGRQQDRYKLAGFRGFSAFLVCLVVLLAAFVLPFSRLLTWCLEIIGSELDERYLAFLGHTVFLGAIAAVICALISLVLAFSHRLVSNSSTALIQGFAVRIATLGYALPGSVLAVGIMLSFTFLDRQLATIAAVLWGSPKGAILVGTVFALVLAYCSRFLAVAYAPVESGFQKINSSIPEAARSLGAGPLRLLTSIYIPLLKPGLLTALIIVFVDVMKEMPATLIMRPFGWDTLAVRIYQMTAEGQWERAALPSITLILAGLLPVILLIRSSGNQVRQ